MNNQPNLTRRRFLQGIGAFGALATMESLLPSYARAASSLISTKSVPPDAIDLVIAETPFQIDDRVVKALTINGTVPGPLLRLREGHETIIRVTNHLKEQTSLHWHGILVPFEMDGVPGVSFPGIDPGKTFEYRYTPKQNGTYWYHSHSGTQEQVGVYAPIIIEPKDSNPVQYDRDYIVMFSDWSFKSPQWMMRKLKAQGDYFDFQQRTARDFLRDIRKKGLSPTIEDYKMWSQMRMSPTDLSDVTGHIYTYLINGMSSDENWTGIFKPHEKVLLRFINGSAMTTHDVRIPGLKMTVVTADGQNIQPVEIDEFRIGVAETYDVVVQPQEERAYTIFAETSDRSGFVRGTLAPQAGMSAAIPTRRKRPLLSMKDMGMAHHGDHENHDNHEETHESHESNHSEEHASPIPYMTPVASEKKYFGAGNEAIPDETVNRVNEPGFGLGNDGRKVLLYTDLRALEPFYDQRPPERELLMYLTGNMDRYIWGFDGKKYSEMPNIQFRHGERLRLTMVNYTMMEHPIHIHGMWFHLENGHGKYLPRKHTILVKPSERVSALITVDAPGYWAFHCHLLYHMLMGMMRVIEVKDASATLSQNPREIMGMPHEMAHKTGDK